MSLVNDLELEVSIQGAKKEEEKDDLPSED